VTVVGAKTAIGSGPATLTRFAYGPLYIVGYLGGRVPMDVVAGGGVVDVDVGGGRAPGLRRIGSRGQATSVLVAGVDLFGFGGDYGSVGLGLSVGDFEFDGVGRPRGRGFDGLGMGTGLGLGLGRGRGRGLGLGLGLGQGRNGGAESNDD